MTIRLNFNDAQFKQQINGAMAKGLQRAGVFLRDRCKVAVNKANAFHHKATFTPAQSARRRGQKTGKVYENMHNAFAGTPPFVRTGMGRNSIVSEFNDNPFAPAVRVGVTANGMYMFYLELGTRRIKPRRWLLQTFEANRAMISKLALSGGK